MTDSEHGRGAAILDELQARKLVQDSTDEAQLRARLDESPITIYAGFDPTADSLHIGHLVPLLLLRRFQMYGHRPIALAGGATGMIGDPGGRSEERNLLDQVTLDANVAAIKAQLTAFLDFEPGPAQATLVDNRDWTGSLGVLEFLRDVGKHVTVNTMLAKESIKNRVESEHGISYTEFSYMLLQANDFWHLFRDRGCELQVGGSDQWGNITAGADLVRRTEGVHVHGLTVPLVTKADGTKFGKSAGGAVWLDPNRTSPYDLFQYFMQTDDRDVERFLLHLTLLPLEEVAAVMADHLAAPDQRVAQRALARAVTALVHGEAAGLEADRASSGFTRRTDSLEEAELEALVDAIPTSHLGRDDFVGADLIDLLAQMQVVKSKSQARQLLAQQGIYLNDVPAGETRALGLDDLVHGRYLMVRRGKKTRHLVVVAEA